MPSRSSGSKPLAGATVVALAVVSAWSANANLNADYPIGDGGLFYVIIKQILAGHFAYPQLVAYNGYQIPFAYSPLAFYCVALFAKVTALPIAKTMNLWVIAWCAMLAPIAYTTARRFLETEVEALAATAFTIAYPPIVVPWIAMGGGITRAPGFAFFLLASGLTWEAFRTRRMPTAVSAGVCGAATLWLHMEFAILYAATFVLFVLFVRPPFRIAAIIAVTGTVLALPWIVVVATHVHAAFEAVHTAQAPQITALTTFLYYSGLQTGAWLPLCGFLCMLAACFVDRNYLWLVWAFAINCLDNHEGWQAAHLPSGLAIGWAIGKLQRAIGPRLEAVPFALLVVLAFAGAAISTHDGNAKFVRLSANDANDMGWMGSHLEQNANILTLQPSSFGDIFNADQTYEWVPALTGLQSSITHQGLEWISSQRDAERGFDFYQLQRCVPQGAGCILDFARRNARGDNVYAYVPNHGNAYPILVAELGANSHFKKIFTDSTSTIFKIETR